MRAVQLYAPRTASVIEVDIPSPGENEVLVKVLASGVCSSDLNAWRGVAGIDYALPPGAPGHEFWGEVAQPGTGAASSFQIGQSVTGLVQAAYAQFALARAEELLVLDEPDTLVLGEPLACATNIARRARVEDGDSVAFVGFGYIAALVSQLLFPRRNGRWIALSRRAESRSLALRLGAAEAFDFEHVPEECWDNYPVVIEATGVQTALDYATWLTAFGGRLVVAGYHADGPRTVNMQSWNWKGIDVINAHERDPGVYMRGMRQGLETVRRSGLDLASLVTHRWPLSRLAEALTSAEQRPADYVKGVVLPWAE